MIQEQKKLNTVNFFFLIEVKKKKIKNWGKIPLKETNIF